MKLIAFKYRKNFLTYHYTKKVCPTNADTNAGDADDEEEHVQTLALNQS